MSPNLKPDRKPNIPSWSLWVLGGVLLLTLLAVGGWFVFPRTTLYGLMQMNRELTKDPQYQALLALESASEITPELHYLNGFPRSVKAQVPVSGADALAGAKNYIETYSVSPETTDLALQFLRFQRRERIC
jgi:hypothetical protein